MGNGAAAVIVDEQGRILLVKQTYGRLNWELPGGYAEPGESAAETAVREVWEETGLRVSAERLTGVYYEPLTDMHHFVFFCLREDEAVTPRPDEQEISECGYWPPDELPRPISDFTVRRINDALDPNIDAAFVIVPPRQWFD